MNLPELNFEQILNITAPRGDTIAFNVNAQLDGAITNFDNLTFSVKKDVEDVTYIFQRFLGDGIVQSAEDSTLYTVNVEPYYTQSLDLGRYYYDIQGEINGSVITICKGILELTYDITIGEQEAPEAVTLVNQLLNDDEITGDITAKLQYAILIRALCMYAVIMKGGQSEEADSFSDLIQRILDIPACELNEITVNNTVTSSSELIATGTVG